MEITREVARLVVNTRFEDIPEQDVEYSKTLLMSALGAMIAGPNSMGSDIVTRYVRRAGGTAEATVFGAKLKTTVENAALANGTYAHATEYEDDSFPEAVSSYTTFPAIIALAERLGSSGEQVIEAFVAGYETQARMGLACRSARKAGYMVLSLIGSLGCAASAAKLLGLDEHKTTMALSIAASQGSGIGYQTGSMSHIIEMGFAARNGLTAALLAADGFTGQPDVLEAPRGLFNMITSGNVESPESIIHDWGRPYRIREVGIKHYPCCYHLQRIIETTLEHRDAGKISGDEIDSISVEVNAFFPTVVQHPEPTDPIEAQFSLPHVVACALLDPRVTPASFSRAVIDEPAHKALRQKVQMIVREDWGWTPTGWTPRITYRMKDGNTIVSEPQRSKGQPPDLHTFDECIPKYRDCVEPVMQEAAIKRSIDVMRNLENVKNMNELIQAIEG